MVESLAAGLGEFDQILQSVPGFNMLTSLSVLVLYDHLLTLSDEVRLIWPAKVRRTNTNIPPAGE